MPCTWGRWRSRSAACREARVRGCSPRSNTHRSNWRATSGARARSRACVGLSPRRWRSCPPCRTTPGKRCQPLRARRARTSAPHISPRHLIYGVLSVDKSRATQHLTRLGVKKEDVALGVPPAPPVGEMAAEISALAWRSARPGVASDTVAGQTDLLGLDREVEVLCSVIAARDVEPPLSIGLFGDWGTGKTFFMKQMEAWINRMKEQTRARDATAAPSAYCTNVVQLWFNAWHYIDANLWASLTAEIFDGLGRALREEAALTQGVDDPARARDRLMTAVASARDVLAEAERRKAAAEADRRAMQERLASLEASESRVAASLVSAAVDVARAQPEVKKKLEQAGKELGVPALRASSNELQAQVQQLRGAAGTLRGLWMVARQFRWRTVALVALASVAGVALWRALSSSVLKDSLSAAAMRFAGGITFLTTLIAPYLPRVLRAKKLVDDTLKKLAACRGGAPERARTAAGLAPPADGGHGATPGGGARGRRRAGAPAGRAARRHAHVRVRDRAPRKHRLHAAPGRGGARPARFRASQRSAGAGAAPGRRRRGRRAATAHRPHRPLHRRSGSLPGGQGRRGAAGGSSVAGLPAVRRRGRCRQPLAPAFAQAKRQRLSRRRPGGRRDVRGGADSLALDPAQLSGEDLPDPVFAAPDGAWRLRAPDPEPGSRRAAGRRGRGLAAA